LRIHKVAAATLMSVIAAGSLLAASGVPAAAATHGNALSRPGFTLETVTVTPATNLPDNKVVTVDASGFTGDTTLYVAECSADVVGKMSLNYCDTTNFQTLTGVTGGAATTQFTVHSGTDFQAPAKSAHCGGFTASGKAIPECLILVADSTTVSDINYVGFEDIAFKDVRAVSKTTIAGKKKVTKGHSLVLTAKTSHGSATPTGSVIFKDNGKKIGKVKESATGKVKLKHKFAKSGKQHITASFSGDATNKPSTGKVTITVKK
jgi:hypothetical protein